MSANAVISTSICIRLVQAEMLLAKLVVSMRHLLGSEIS
jgi:hypothetical protein